MESCWPRENPSVLLDQSCHHYSYCKENVFNSVCCFYTKRDQFEPYAWQNWVFILWLFLPVMLDELPASHLVEWKRQRHSVGTTGFLAAQRTESERHFLSDPFSLDSLPLSPLSPPPLSLFLSHSFSSSSLLFSHTPISPPASLQLNPHSNLTIFRTFFHTWPDSEALFIRSVNFYPFQFHSQSYPLNLTWPPSFFGPVSWAATQHPQHPISHFLHTQIRKFSVLVYWLSKGM